MTGPQQAARVRAAKAISKGSHGDPTERQGINEGMRVLSYLLAGPLCYGGLGWLVDRLLGTEFLVAVGVLVGTALSIILIIRRYVRTDS